jgi:transcriptional regulator with XRE-family HTH domain
MTPVDLKAARARLGLSRIAFAETLGISRNSVTAYESGKRPVPLTVRLAIAAVLLGIKDVWGEDAHVRKAG